MHYDISGLLLVFIFTKKANSNKCNVQKLKGVITVSYCKRRNRIWNVTIFREKYIESIKKPPYKLIYGGFVLMVVL